MHRRLCLVRLRPAVHDARDVPHGVRPRAHRADVRFRARGFDPPLPRALRGRARRHGRQPRQPAPL